MKPLFSRYLRTDLKEVNKLTSDFHLITDEILK